MTVEHTITHKGSLLHPCECINMGIEQLRTLLRTQIATEWRNYDNGALNLATLHHAKIAYDVVSGIGTTRYLVLLY